MSELAVGSHSPAWEKGKASIQDLFVLPLESQQMTEGEIINIIHGSDHLLRRFGGLEALRVHPQPTPPMRLRLVADEIYALLEGKIECAWLDLREASPSYNSYVESTFSDPTLILAPFGVAFGFQAQERPALILRLSTHSLSEKDDLQQLPWRRRA